MLAQQQANISTEATTMAMEVSVLVRIAVAMTKAARSAKLSAGKRPAVEGGADMSGVSRCNNFASVGIGAWSVSLVSPDPGALAAAYSPPKV